MPDGPAHDFANPDAALRFGPQARRRSPDAAREAIADPNAPPRNSGRSRARPALRSVLLVGLVGIAPAIALAAVILWLRHPAASVAPPSRGDVHTAELERQRTELAAEVEVLRQEAGANRAALERLEAHVTAASQPAPATIPPPAKLTQAATLPPPIVPAVVEQPSVVPAVLEQSPAIGLPQDALPHVILQYARGSASARARATTLGLTLRARGLEVADTIAASAGIAASNVGFFYADDRRSAQRIASDLTPSGLPALRPIQRRVPANGPLPRPGTIEVGIAGP